MPPLDLEPRLLQAEARGDLLRHQVPALQPQRIGGVGHQVPFLRRGLPEGVAEEEVGEGVGLVHRRVGVDRRLGGAQGSRDVDAGDRAVVRLAVGLEVEPGVVDRPAGEDHPAAVEGQVLPVGLVDAVLDLELADRRGRPCRAARSPARCR